ncbi:MAG: hypothetical protein LUC98_12655 [Lachnospiraceae bacterium]|nr:hypothetical protein [Lachnospiraceae bacterium]
MKKEHKPNAIKTIHARVVSVFLILLIPLVFNGCGAKSTQDTVSEALDLDVSGGREASNYDTHSGNGDGASCIVLNFEDDTVLEEIQSKAEWKAFPFDETVLILVYGIEDEKSKMGPYLTDENGNPLVPEIQNGYYLLIDRQAEEGKATEEDILHRNSFNFTLGLYDTDTNTLYFCQLDT